MKTKENLKPLTVIFLLILTLPISVSFADTQPKQALLFYNRACGACVRYIDQELTPLFSQRDIKLKRYDYINDPKNRLKLNRLNEKWNIPSRLRGHLAIFIDQKIVLQGHVPPHIIADLLRPENQKGWEKILVYQDKMDEATTYTAWAFKGKPKEYSIHTPVVNYIQWFRENKEHLSKKANNGREETFGLLPLVISTGLLDGINPCAIAVLLFFIAFLFSMNRTRIELVKVGTLYIGVIYLTYLGIGLGILQALVLSGSPHLMAKIGAGLLIFLGLVNIKDYFWYGRWFSLSPTGKLHGLSTEWLKRATLPATGVGAFFVGLCTFPCSGGIYVAILGLLSSKTSYWSGFGYLLLYNLMFVVPLVVILLLVGNRRMAGKLTRWQSSKKRSIKLVTGVGMVLLGIGILFWLL